MEKKYKSLSIYEFQKRFPDSKACKEYLAKQKWSSGYKCHKCGHNKYGKGQQELSRKCTKCQHQESPTANTLFHKVKFPLHKAFAVIYYMSTSKKGIASTELSRRLAISQKSAWLFRRKIVEAMKGAQKPLLNGMVEVDETFVGGKAPGKRGRGASNKRMVVFALSRKGKGITGVYGQVIKQAGAKTLKPFVESFVAKAAKLRTDQWRGYSSLKQVYNLEQVPSKGGKNFMTFHRFVMGFKSWLRGIHHYVRDLSAYVEEYTYRFNRHWMKESVFDDLLVRAAQQTPVAYKMIKGNLNN